VQIVDVPFATIDWSSIPRVEHAGEHGKASWRTVEVGNLRVRLVEYTPGYVADHWCSRGHVVFVLEGELLTELRDGRAFTLTAGMSYHLASGAAEAHRSASARGAKLFIVD
jgi:quercetin dioxygenase-like cupin family protein